jgi:hypothetical protein
MAPFCSYHGKYNVQSRDGGGNKMVDTCILGPIASTKMEMEVGGGGNLTGKTCHFAE